MPPFDLAAFYVLYPQFVGVFADAQVVELYTYEALIVGSKVLACFKNVNYKYSWSLKVLAHILSIYQRGLTSRVIGVTEDSVTGTFEATSSEQKEWWDSTPYGRACWSVIRNRGGATIFTGRRCYPGYPYPYGR